jgi:hypothetical protein
MKDKGGKMKKILALVIISVIIITSTPTAALAKEQKHSITMKELDDLAAKYNIQTTIVDKEVPKELIYNDITKEELENLIIEGLYASSKPITYDCTIAIDPETLIEESDDITIGINNSDSITNNASTNSIITDTWIPCTGSKTFYTTNSDVSQYLTLKYTMGTDYKFEMYYNSQNGVIYYRNWQFTGAGPAYITHLNPDPYYVTGTASSALWRSDVATHDYSVVYDAGVYVSLGGAIVRVPLGTGVVGGDIYYYISQVQ